MNRLAVIGLGKLGSPMVACFASKGFEVMGADFDTAKAQLLSQGQAPVEEPGLAELLAGCRDRIKATRDAMEACLWSEATFLVVPTPSEPDGSFTLSYLLDACESVGAALRQKQDWHLVIVTSTVSPGSMDRFILPALEQKSGKRCGVDFGLCYSPEFIALGDVIHGLLQPDFLLVGESDSRAGDTLSAIYASLCESDPPQARMNFVNAELCKLSVNAYVTTKMTFANTLARLCEKLPNADVDVVTKALGLDSRIGGKYLKGAIAYGGPCFPRDNVALACLARKVGCSAPLSEATDAYNRQQTVLLADLIQSYLPSKGRVAILGLTYKPATPVVEEAPGVHLGLELLRREVRIQAYDPANLIGLPKEIPLTKSLQLCVQGADVAIVTTAWPEFKDMDLESLARLERPRVLIDCWRLYSDRDIPNGVHYVALGKGPKRSFQLTTSIGS